MWDFTGVKALDFRGWLIFGLVCGRVESMKNNYRVINKTLKNDKPRSYELSAAQIVANYFKADVIFLRPMPMKSPDLDVRGKIWELKSPTGDGKNTIHNNFKEARRQTINIIIDLRRCKMHKNRALSRIRAEIRKRKRKKGQILVINKKGKILDFSELLK